MKKTAVLAGLVAIVALLGLNSCDAMFDSNLFKTANLGQFDISEVDLNSPSGIADAAASSPDFFADLADSGQAADAIATLMPAGYVAGTTIAADLQAAIGTGEVSAEDVLLASVIEIKTSDAGVVFDNFTGEIGNFLGGASNEDIDGDKALDLVDEDLNSNDILDAGEDMDNDGNLDVYEDSNGNGVLDVPPTMDEIIESVLPSSIAAQVNSVPDLAFTGAAPTEFAAILDSFSAAGAGFQAVVDSVSGLPEVGGLTSGDIAQFALVSVIVDSLSVSASPTPEGATFISDFTTANGVAPTPADVLWAAMNGSENAVGALGGTDIFSSDAMFELDMNGDPALDPITGDKILADTTLGDLLTAAGLAAMFI